MNRDPKCHITFIKHRGKISPPPSASATLRAVPRAVDALKASSLNDMSPMLHELRRSDPHLFETAQGGHDRCTYPGRETPVRRSRDLDGSSSGRQLF